MPTNRRRWVAALLSFLQPGVGHLYLREWSRGLSWFLLWVATALFAAGISTVPPATVAGLTAFIDRFLAALTDLPLARSLALAAVTGFAVVDAYVVAGRTDRRRPGEEPTCPACGKEVDPELDFCHWCTTELEWVER
ncbi:DUF7575 domain-containing protein [Halorarius halobius]|uniref:DUF7575 domain-containing protein n=1 Tax=Halorarius halobius TaxID=2962671 RepID=UPI0020CD4C3C|nr:hypothetical protein [Halorarius halobius]